MNQPVSYECSRCEKTANATADTPPAGWGFRKGFLVCEDCEPDQPETPQLAIAPIEPVSVRCPTAIPLLSGAYLDLADPDCSVVQPIDIAAGMRQGLFGAQTSEFFTLAQHALLVLTLVNPIARKIGGDKGLQLRRCALMQDAADAFIHNISAPLKRQLNGYRPIEARLQQRLADRFDWSWTDARRDTVKLASIQALAIEQRDLGKRVDPWPIFDRIDRAALTGIKITRVWHPDEAQERFLGAFADLFPEDERKAA